MCWAWLLTILIGSQRSWKSVGKNWGVCTGYGARTLGISAFEILIDSVSVKSGTLVDDMSAVVDGKKKDYGFEPPQEINDPDDFKPDDWVDEAKIKDPVPSWE